MTLSRALPTEIGPHNRVTHPNAQHCPQTQGKQCGGAFLLPPTPLSYIRMISDLDIYQSAKVIIKRYGKDAQIHSTKRASAMLDKGDLDAYAVWMRILRAVGELQRAAPKSGEAVH